MAKTILVRILSVNEYTRVVTTCNYIGYKHYVKVPLGTKMADYKVGELIDCHYVNGVCVTDCLSSFSDYVEPMTLEESNKQFYELGGDY